MQTLGAAGFSRGDLRQVDSGRAKISPPPRDGGRPSGIPAIASGSSGRNRPGIRSPHMPWPKHDECCRARTIPAAQTSECRRSHSKTHRRDRNAPGNRAYRVDTLAAAGHHHLDDPAAYGNPGDFQGAFDQSPQLFVAGRPDRFVLETGQFGAKNSPARQRRKPIVLRLGKTRYSDLAIREIMGIEFGEPLRFQNQIDQDHGPEPQRTGRGQHRRWDGWPDDSRQQGNGKGR